MPNQPPDNTHETRVPATIDAVLERHVEDLRPWYTEIDGKPVYRTSCVYCLGTWPCDAYTLALMLQQAMTVIDRAYRRAIDMEDDMVSVGIDEDLPAIAKQLTGGDDGTP